MALRFDELPTQDKKRYQVFGNTPTPGLNLPISLTTPNVLPLAPVEDMISPTATGNPYTASPFSFENSVNTMMQPPTIPSVATGNPYERFATNTLPASTAPISEQASGLGPIVPYSGPGKIYYRDRTPGYMQKDGFKNEVANNPGNIASKDKLYFGATGFLKSKFNGQDHADSSLLVYPSAKAGFAALDKQMSAKSYNGPINKSFAKWQKKGFAGKLAALQKDGIDVTKSYKQLTANEKYLMRKVWANHEGWRGKTY